MESSSAAPTTVRPILKTATKTGSRTRFLADSASKYKSYTQTFHYTSFSSNSSSSSSSRRSAFSTSSSSSSFDSLSSSADTASLPSSQSSTASSSTSSQERKRSDEIFLTPGDRRVTFSQFTKTPRKSKAKKALAESRELTSGFVFSTGGEAEKRKQAKRKHELQVMQKLYLASRKRTVGWKHVLFEQFTVLKEVRAWTRRCVAFFKASPVVALVRKALKQRARQQKKQKRQQRSRRLRRGSQPHRQNLGEWSAFDFQADHEYMRHLALQPEKTVSTSESTSSSPGVGGSHELLRHQRVPSDEPVPDLTPVKQGSFSSLLRREGIPVDEDEQREKIAMMQDLRGVGHAAIRWKVSSAAS